MNELDFYDRMYIVVLLQTELECYDKESDEYKHIIELIEYFAK